MRRTDGYAPLRQYLATGDGRSVALIAADGAVDWLAVPQLDHPPTWSALLDPDHGGRLELAPEEPFEVTQRYAGPTNVVETTFSSDSGTVRVTDSLNSGLAGRLPWTEFARRVEGVNGSVAMRWRVGAGRALGSAEPWVDPDGRVPLLGTGGTGLALILDGVGDARVEGVEYCGTFHTAPGSRGLLAVAGGAEGPLHLPRAADVQNRLDLSLDAWRTWSEQFDWDGPWPDEVLRSALALKLLLYSPTGAIAAAATTSVPEGIGGCKNWDYRYTWIRDTAYTIDAFVRCGMHEEVHAALAWLLATVGRHGPDLRPFHTLHGDLPDGKSECDVPGYRRSRPVVSGNDAERQLQLGAAGDLFQAVYLSVLQSSRLDGRTRHVLTGLADRCAEQWREPDSGMWELHDLHHFTISKMSCWQALDRAAELADLGELPGNAEGWRTEAERIRSWVNEHCWSPERRAYLMHPDGDELDAGVLLGARFGFDRGDRMRSTIDAVRAELGAGPALYRYTGMAKEEGAFVACTFWAVEALALTGRREEAVLLMDEMLELVGGVDLLAEMVDPETGDYLGNLPQALSHLAMINAAAAVADAG
ncbi:MAG TPA: glycoside hydrolase family 15 protein [Sporichthya sp.]|nr:glycoside hydrolase family 15 protein [Sporichthya sp.]